MQYPFLFLESKTLSKASFRKDKNRSPQSYGEPGISLSEQEIQVEEGGLMGTPTAKAYHSVK